MARFKNEVYIKAEFSSEWPDNAQEALSEMNAALSRWASRNRILLNSIRKNTEVETVSEYEGKEEKENEQVR